MRNLTNTFAAVLLTGSKVAWASSPGTCRFERQQEEKSKRNERRMVSPVLLPFSCKSTGARAGSPGHFSSLLLLRALPLLAEPPTPDKKKADLDLSSYQAVARTQNRMHRAGDICQLAVSKQAPPQCIQRSDLPLVGSIWLVIDLLDCGQSVNLCGKLLDVGELRLLVPNFADQIEAHFIPNRILPKNH
jgi:hypothetical protein